MAQVRFILTEDEADLLLGYLGPFRRWLPAAVADLHQRLEEQRKQPGAVGDYCSGCGAQLEVVPSIPDFIGDRPLLEEYDQTQSYQPQAEGRIWRALEYMNEPKHQPRKGSWSRIRFETVRAILNGERVDWRV